MEDSKLGALLAASSVLLSLVAIVISARSCSVAERAHEFSVRSYAKEQQLILKASFDDKRFAITVSPVDSAATLLRGAAHFPNRIFGASVPVDGSGRFMHMESVRLAMEKFVDRQIERTPDYLTIAEYNVPMIFNAYYVAKGDTLTDSSLYALQVLAVVGEETGQSPSVTAKDLVFVRRLTEEELRSEPSALLDHMIGLSGQGGLLLGGSTIRSN